MSKPLDERSRGTENCWVVLPLSIDGAGSKTAPNVEEPPAMPEPANYSIIETLRDGRNVEIRAQRPEDGDGLRALRTITATNWSIALA